MTGIRTNVSDTDLLIRNGWAWRYEWTDTVGAGVTVLLGLTIGPEGGMLLDRSFVTNGDDTLFSLYRGTDWTGGTPWVGKNRNDRYWANTTQAAVVTASVGVTATLLDANRMGSLRLFTAGPKQTLITGEGSNIILAPGGSYVVSVTNSGTGSSVDALSLLLTQDRVTSGRFIWPAV